MAERTTHPAGTAGASVELRLRGLARAWRSGACEDAAANSTGSALQLAVCADELDSAIDDLLAESILGGLAQMDLKPKPLSPPVSAAAAIIGFAAVMGETLQVVRDTMARSAMLRGDAFTVELAAGFVRIRDAFAKAGMR
jgi:hypothetical protein